MDSSTCVTRLGITLLAFAAIGCGGTPHDTSDAAEDLPDVDAADVDAADQLSDEIELVSLSTEGGQGNSWSESPDISNDARYVTFVSQASNLVEDGSSNTGVFLRDRSAGTLQRVSIASDGTPGDAASTRARISGGGRDIVFESHATNLVAGDTNDNRDVFVHDRITATTERISVSSTGEEGNDRSDWASISADGNIVAFRSFATNLTTGDNNAVGDIFVHDRSTGMTEIVSVASDGSSANGESAAPDISEDGRYVVFLSSASNLVANDTNGEWDVFVYDRQVQDTQRVSVSTDGLEGNDRSTGIASVSGDGRYVAFNSWATNLVTDDTNGAPDVFVRDRDLETTERVSVASDTSQALGALAAGFPTISTDGRYVAFESAAFNLVPGDTNGETDVFAHDRISGLTVRVNLAANGDQSSGVLSEDIAWPHITASGRHIAFDSRASNLVQNDTNGYVDVFVVAISAEQ